MRRFTIPALVLSIAWPAIAGTVGDEDAIRETIAVYAEGYSKRDRAMLERAFDAPHGHVKSFVRTKQGPDRVKVTATPDWIDKIAAAKPGDPVEVRVLSVTIVNDHIANAFLDFDGSLYDMMLMAKIDGVWKIVNKVSIYQDPAPR